MAASTEQVLSEDEGECAECSPGEGEGEGNGLAAGGPTPGFK